ncbi:hypothetical protein D3C81_2149950 [compost metagenome]
MWQSSSVVWSKVPGWHALLYASMVLTKGASGSFNCRASSGSVMAVVPGKTGGMKRPIAC